MHQVCADKLYNCSMMFLRNTANLCYLLLGLWVLPPAAHAMFNASGEEDLLPPEQAFSVSQSHLDNGDLQLNYFIAPDYYLYQKRLKFVLEDGSQLEPSLPAADTYDDPFEGPTPIYRHTLSVTLPQDMLHGAQLMAHFQGCADVGVCYPPQKTRLDLTNSPASTSTPRQATASLAGERSEADQDRYARWIGEKQLPWIVASFFGLGLLLALTPCVFPMIPIVTTMVVGQKQRSAASGFILSSVYVLAMALTYTVAGVLVGLGGASLQASLQHPAIIGALATLFVVLALAMFGLFNVQMPNAIQSKLNNMSSRQRGGGILSAAILGMLSALIVGPCVTAPLIGALIYISQTGDPVLGGFALFALGLGMGLPLIAIGTGASAWMPKAGNWMEAVKQFFGFLMLATAIWMLDRVVPFGVTVALVSLLSLAMGVTLLPRQLSNAAARLRLGGAIILLFYAAALGLGLLSGQASLSQPLAGLSSAQAPAQTKLPFESVQSLETLESALLEAERAGQPVMLDFYADWCVSCKEMEHFTFSDPSVAQTLEGWRLLKADVTANSETDQALLQSLGLFGPPAILFYTADDSGHLIERDASRVVGFVKAEAFRQHIQSLNAKP